MDKRRKYSYSENERQVIHLEGSTMLGGKLTISDVIVEEDPWFLEVAKVYVKNNENERYLWKIVKVTLNNVIVHENDLKFIL